MVEDSPKTRNRAAEAKGLLACLGGRSCLISLACVVTSTTVHETQGVGAVQPQEGDNHLGPKPGLELGSH